MQFIDYVTIHISSGHGGKGCTSFRREKYVPRGGPDGGDGGRGGHAIFRADPQLGTLLDLRYQRTYPAENGRPGQGKKKFGRDGKDCVIEVPVGSVIKDADSGEVLADLDSPGAEFLAARGGKGGLGNSNFATSVRQAPTYSQPGLPGEEKHLLVELKLLADVGLIGLPNAGKSTLISVISNARPKIADYPFTTLVPNLGVVKFEDHRSFVVADIPGLIEGAHEGVGLGFRFLRHVERTRLLLHLVDISVATEGDPVESMLMLNRELELYSPELSEKPMAVAATKTDSAGEGEALDKLSAYCKTNGIDFFPVSAVTNTGMKDLLAYLAAKVVENA
jgi:GTP-binding protein